MNPLKRRKIETREDKTSKSQLAKNTIGQGSGVSCSARLDPFSSGVRRFALPHLNSPPFLSSCYVTPGYRNKHSFCSQITDKSINFWKQARGSAELGCTDHYTPTRAHTPVPSSLSVENTLITLLTDAVCGVPMVYSWIVDVTKLLSGVTAAGPHARLRDHVPTLLFLQLQSCRQVFTA